MTSHVAPAAPLLDLMVLDSADADLDADWAALAMAADGEEAWAEAQRRRTRLDAAALLATRAEWLAASLLAIRRSARTARGALAVLGRAGPTPALLLGHLGDAPEIVEVRAGGYSELGLDLGREVSVQVAPDVDVTWQVGVQRGPLPGRRWRLEAGEAPVLLVATDRQGRAGAVVLVERQIDGKTPG